MYILARQLSKARHVSRTLLTRGCTRVYIFSAWNIFIDIYAIFNFYCDIFLLVRSEQGVIYISNNMYKNKIILALYKHVL